MSILYTADLHLGHENIIASCRRPFNDVIEMEEILIRNWNCKVELCDDVYIVGDVSYRSPYHISYYLKRMIGKKHLIIGNHDMKWIKNCKDIYQYFETVDNMTVINDGKNVITLCHYPMLEWNRSRYAKEQENATSWLVHGHIHNNTLDDTYEFIKSNLPCALNAGIDINGYMPVNFQELLQNNNNWYQRI